MADAALELYNQLSSYARLKELIDNGESEGLHLECKALTEPRLTRDIQAHLAKALSGFSNTAGGVIIWGISTTKHSHSGLDILTQIEPTGNCENLQKQIHSRIPTLTNPPVLGFRTKTIKKQKGDSRGIVLVHIPQTQGDPVQSAKDNLFYFRTGDDFSVAPYEIIKRLFASTETPDLYPLLHSNLATVQEDGSWKIPIGVENRSSAIAERGLVSVEVSNPAACESVTVTKFRDTSNFNPGKKIFMENISGVVHKGLSLVLGDLRIKMKIRKRPKRRLDLIICLYANKMRARQVRFTIQLTKTNLVIQDVADTYLY